MGQINAFGNIYSNTSMCDAVGNTLCRESIRHSSDSLTCHKSVAKVGVPGEPCGVRVITDHRRAPPELGSFIRGQYFRDRVEAQEMACKYSPWRGWDCA